MTPFRHDPFNPFARVHDETCPCDGCAGMRRLNRAVRIQVGVAVGALLLLWWWVG